MTISEYNKCVDNHSDALYRFILKNIKGIDAAQDIVQGAFMKMWEKREDISGEKAKSYLFTVAYHMLIDVTRYNGRFLDIESVETTSFYETNEFSDLKEILNQAIEKLPVDQKTVLLLRDYEGYSYNEISEITKLNESQVKVYIYRARLFLKKYIGKPEVVL